MRPDFFDPSDAKVAALMKETGMSAEAAKRKLRASAIYQGLLNEEQMNEDKGMGYVLEILKAMHRDIYKE